MVDRGSSTTFTDSSRHTRQTPDTPYLATLPMPEQHRFPIHRWRPRAGRTWDYEQWHVDVTKLYAAFGTTLHQHATSQPVITPGSPPHIQQMAALRLGEWQQINTAIYWHVLPTIDIDGPMYLRDTRIIGKWWLGNRAAGDKLVQWAMEFASVDTIDKQRKLVHAMHTTKLTPTATCHQLTEHMQRLYETWKLVAGNDPERPHGYYLQLIDTLPVATDGKLTVLTSLRAWLALQLKDMPLGGCRSLTDVDMGIDVIFDYAREIGLPIGAPQSKSGGAQQLVYLATACDDCIDLGDKDTEVNVIDGSTKKKAQGQRPQPAGSNSKAANNECDFCDSYVCQSRKSSTGSAACRCRHDSTFDVTKVSKGAGRYITMARAWHKANPGAQSLKNKKFTLRKDDGKGSDGTGGGGGAKRASLTAIISVTDLFGGGDQAEFDAWLHDSGADGCADSVQVIGDIDLTSVLTVEAESLEAIVSGDAPPGAGDEADTHVDDSTLSSTDVVAMVAPPLDVSEADELLHAANATEVAPVTPLPFPSLSPAATHTLVPAAAQLASAAAQLVTAVHAPPPLTAPPPPSQHVAIDAALLSPRTTCWRASERLRWRRRRALRSWRRPLARCHAHARATA